MATVGCGALVSAAVAASGTIKLKAIVAGPPPASAPTIVSPADGETFTESLIVVSGGCLADLLVQITSNGVFVGSTYCQSDGTYSLEIDLFDGRNSLVAIQYDSLEQASPASSTVTVFKEAAHPLIPSNPVVASQPPGQPAQGTISGGAIVAYFPLRLVGITDILSASANQPFSLPIDFEGGEAPYQVTVNWGDGLGISGFLRPDTQLFYASHTYRSGGYYVIAVRVEDQRGQKAYLQYGLLVNGIVMRLPTTLGATLPQPELILLVISTLVLLAFIAGLVFERHWWAGKHRSKSTKDTAKT